MCSPHLRSEELFFFSLRAEYLPILFEMFLHGVLSILLQLLIYWSIDLHSRTPSPPRLMQFCFPWSQLPTVNLGLEEDGLPSDTGQKVNSSCTMPHAHVIDLTSFHHGSILSSHIVARRRVSAGPWGILRENATMLAWLSWHPSVTILVLHLPLCLLYKFNFVVSMQVPENTQCV